jgi:malonyl-CoA decarboxylase
MNRSLFFADLLNTIADRGRMMLNLVRGDEPVSADSLARMCTRLLSSQGEASGVAYAREILERWRTLDADGRLDFLHVLRDRFGTDHIRLAAAVHAYRATPDDRTALDLHEAAESARQELFRRLNLAPGGIETLVRMREDLLARLTMSPDLAIVDADFTHLLSSWFNRGFLVLRRIDWSTPANVLEKIIRYEAVHAIHTWDDLRRRIEPDDRLCYAFFHPQLGDEPLIFLEVALTRAMSTTIAALLAGDRPLVRPQDATTAVFYSISNCQEGLRGISFGNFLIKQVVEDLHSDLPGLTDFVTLSPVPGFARWLAEQAETLPSAAEALDLVADEDWQADEPRRARAGQALLPLAAQYFLEARTVSGKVIDPVARFHLANGARLERINLLGDLSPGALRQAHGLMVNYRYKLDDIEKNHELFVARNDVAAAPAVRRLLPKAARPAAPQLPAPGRSGRPERDI